MSQTIAARRGMSIFTLTLSFAPAIVDASPATSRNMELPGEQLVSKMMTLLFEQGIGGLLRPWQIKRIARAETDARIESDRRLVQAEREYEEIRAGRLLVSPTGDLVRPGPPRLETRDLNRVREPSPADYSAAERVIVASATAAVADNLRRDINVARAILAAEDEILRDASAEAFPEGVPDRDWLHRWRDAAAEVSSQELQGVWGRVLAGEVKSPGAYSLRTVDFLRNVSRAEAEEISLLSQFVVDDGVLWTGAPNLLDSFGIDYDLVQRITDLGLIAGANYGGRSVRGDIEYLSTRPDAFRVSLRIRNRYLIVNHADAARIVTFKTAYLTALGREVFSLSTMPASEPYVRALGCAIAAHAFVVELADGVIGRSGEVQYSNVEVLHCPTPAPKADDPFEFLGVKI